MSIYLGTDHVLGYEPCYGLYELNLQSPGSKGFHRYQIVIVARNDKLYEFRRDMGLASSHSSIQFRIPGAIENERGQAEILHNVSEMQDLADMMRNEPSHLPEPSDLAGQYRRHVEKQKYQLRGRKVYATGK